MVVGSVSNTTPPPPWGFAICGSVGLPKIWVGGSLKSPPPPPPPPCAGRQQGLARRRFQDGEVRRVLSATNDVGNLTQENGVPDHQVSRIISAAQHFHAFCPLGKNMGGLAAQSVGKAARSAETNKKEQGPGWLSILKEALTRGKGVMRVGLPQAHTFPRIASSAQITSRAQGAGGKRNLWRSSTRARSTRNDANNFFRKFSGRN